MIELTDVSKRYGRRRATHALRGVSLHVPAGAVWAVVGPNGAGKSTLLSVLLGFIRPTSGTVSIDGDAPRDYLRHEGAGYLPERFTLPRAWTVGQSLRMLSRLEHADDADRAIALLGLEPHLEKRGSELSRGLLQRAGLAQALLTRHALIILDEPTEGLDPVWRIRLRDIIADLRAAGSTVILASHDLTEVERSADRAVLLESGAIREVLEIQPAAPASAYRVRLAAPSSALHEAFPAATAVDELTYTVEVADAAELSARLGALIALGGLIESVEPVRQALEDRVRDALERT